MTVLTITLIDQVFDRKCAEAAYLALVLNRAAQEIQKNQGTLTSGTMKGTNALGQTNQALGAWTYTSSASNP